MVRLLLIFIPSNYYTLLLLISLVSSSTTSYSVPGSTCREVEVSMGTSDDQKALVVTYQRLRPGVDIEAGRNTEAKAFKMPTFAGS
jgi:hypothetical protein